MHFQIVLIQGNATVPTICNAAATVTPEWIATVMISNMGPSLKLCVRQFGHISYLESRSCGMRKGVSFEAPGVPRDMPILRRAVVIATAQVMYLRNQ